MTDLSSSNIMAAPLALLFCFLVNNKYLPPNLEAGPGQVYILLERSAV